MKTQCHNPYLPLHEHIPDGEPHIFGDRLYIFGSHDLENGNEFCELDYVSCQLHLMIYLIGDMRV